MRASTETRGHGCDERADSGIHSMLLAPSCRPWEATGEDLGHCYDGKVLVGYFLTKSLLQL